MSADIIPMPAPRDSAPLANIAPLPSPPPEDALSKLLKNPLLLAGGAILAGMALTRLLARPSVQKLARELADEALKRARQSTGDAPAAAPSLVDEVLESIRPQITAAARQFLATVLKKS